MYMDRDGLNTPWSERWKLRVMWWFYFPTKNTTFVYTQKKFGRSSVPKFILFFHTVLYDWSSSCGNDGRYHWGKLGKRDTGLWTSFATFCKPKIVSKWKVVCLFFKSGRIIITAAYICDYVESLLSALQILIHMWAPGRGSQPWHYRYLGHYWHLGLDHSGLWGLSCACYDFEQIPGLDPLNANTTAPTHTHSLWKPKSL